MILVVADDLSGAAEMAQLAAARGLSVDVRFQFDGARRSDVLVVDTETRRLAATAAAARVGAVIRDALRAHPPDWIFKKTDSVLRGNARVEMEGALEAAGERRIMFIPANPSKARIIRDGRLFIDGQPLHLTAFAADPDHPQRDADVVRALGKAGRWPVRAIGSGAALSERGVVIPDALTEADVKERARETRDAFLTAGAADYFAALLECRAQPVAAPRGGSGDTGRFTGTTLFVSGSLAAWDAGVGRAAGSWGVPVLEIGPSKVWAAETIAAFERRGAALMAIGRPDDRGGEGDRWLDALAEAAGRVLEKRTIERVFLEGGQTAAAVAARCGWTRFQAVASHLDGIACLRPDDEPPGPWLFIKPGSYPWPADIWRRVSEERHPA